MDRSFEGLDVKELDYADTLFVRDIENRVFQSIVVQCIANIEGITLAQGGLFENLLGRDQTDSRLRAISVQQHQKDRKLTLKIELNIQYGLSIPEKAEEVQTKITKEIVRLTGMHINSIHTVFKNIYFEKLDNAKLISDEEMSTQDEELVETFSETES